MRPYLYTTLLVLFASCAPFIYINDNEYRILSNEQRSELRQFGDPPVTDSSDKYLVEITVDDLVSSFSKAKYTWVHIWVPFCSGENCKPLYYYDNIMQKHQQMSWQMFMISTSYDYKNTKKQLPYFGGDIYVIKDSLYGHNHGKNLIKFETELKEKAVIDSPIRYMDMLFRGDTLIYNTDLMTNAKMDSVIAANP